MKMGPGVSKMGYDALQIDPAPGGIRKYLA